MSEVLYRIAGLEVRYAGRKTPALDLRAPMAIHRGEILALVGPSGAGKSTLLRSLAFVEPPTSGTVEFLDWRYHARQLPPLHVRRRVALVFQRPILLSATVAENVAYGLRVRGVRDVDAKVNAALAQVHLEALANAHARTLSGGEAQRVALARALVLEPYVLLLDEPTANLDPHNVSLIEEIIRRHHDQHGTTFVIVTHNVFQARRLATRAGLLLGGHLVELCDAREFFEAPRDPRTLAFVRGDMIY